MTIQFCIVPFNYKDKEYFAQLIHGGMGFVWAITDNNFDQVEDNGVVKHFREKYAT